jgi:hypothetical protein
LFDLSFRHSKRWLQRVQDLCEELAVLAWQLTLIPVMFAFDQKAVALSDPNQTIHASHSPAL